MPENKRRFPRGGAACTSFLLVSLLTGGTRLGAQTQADATAPGARDRTGSPATASRPEEEPGAAANDLLGLRQKLAARGLRIEAFLVADLSRSLHGGVAPGADAFRHLFELSFTLDTERLLGLRGGKLFLDFQTQHGRHGSDALAGDVQGFSNIDAQGFNALYELWYEQILAGGKLRLKLGKIDATNEFAFVENGAELLNSSAGFSPTIVGFPTYPDPATGAVVFVSPIDWLYLGGGLFDGATQAGFPTGTRGPATLFGPPGDLFWIGEAGIRRTASDGRTNRLGLGLTHHTGNFARLAAGNASAAGSATEDGATSVYLVLDRTLARRKQSPPADGTGAVWFLQLGRTEASLALVDLHAGAGIVWNGTLPARRADSFGLMASYVHLSSVARAAGGIVDDHEIAYEAFYLLQFAPWFSLKPDLQYIVHPGATGQPDAVVGTLRLELAL